MRKDQHSGHNLQDNSTHPTIPPALVPTKPKTRSWGHARTIAALMLREMTTTYGRSPGGYVWAILEPLAMILLLSVGFQILFRTPALGSSFILFYATGYLPFNMFLKCSQKVMGSITFSRALLSYPVVSWFDAILARALLNILTDMLVAYILLATILLLVDTKAVLDFGAILQSFGLAALLGLGVGMVNCVFISFFSLWETAWKVLTRPLFLASGVIWIYEDLPQVAREILIYNPLLHITAKAREGYFPLYDPSFVSMPTNSLLALTLIALGLLLMRRYHQEILTRR